MPALANPNPLPAFPSVAVSRIFGNNANLVRTADVAVSAQRASSQLLLLSQQRRGNGTVTLQGPYTGAQDSVIDVEVLGGVAGELMASRPIVSGVGSGSLAVQSIDLGAVAQTLKFTLLDAGLAAQFALLDFFGVQLAARAEGAAGNAVALSVVRRLVFTDMPFATLEPLPVGSAQFDGPQFDWGQPAATDAGIPAGALRVAFTGFPTVHRAWKTWDKGRFVYHLDPPLAYAVPSDTRLRKVSGDYELSVTDGVLTEVYTATTMYEFLVQVQARSALVQVLGVVAQDRAVGGQAVTDIPLRTDAHALPVIASSNRGAPLRVIEVLPTAATENITVTCLVRGVGGAAQAWSVSGGVSGALPAAYTGEVYASGPVHFQIPLVPVAVALGASINARFLPTSRQTDEGLPAICFKPLLLGAAAIDKEVTFEYRKRPPADCSCSAAPALPVSLQCLGLGPSGDVTMDAEYQTRLVELHNWHAGFVTSNVVLMALDKADIDIADECTRILGEGLAEVYDTPVAAIAWDSVFTQLRAELAAYMGVIGPVVTLGTGGGTNDTTWLPGRMAVGASYLNPGNHHNYRIDGITVDSVATTVMPPDAALPVSTASVWLTTGAQFTVSELTDVVLTVTDVGASRPWGDFVVGRVYDGVRGTSAELPGAPGVPGAPLPLSVRVRVEEILVAGVAGPLPAHVRWEADRFDGVGVLRGEDVDTNTLVEVRTMRLPAPAAGANVVLGDEIVNGLNHHGYRVDAVKVGGVVAPVASMRLPTDSAAIWAVDASTFDVPMPVAARTTLEVLVTDLGLAAPTQGLGLGVVPWLHSPLAHSYGTPSYPPRSEEYQTYLDAFYSSQNVIIDEYNAGVQVNNQYQREHLVELVTYFPKKYAAKMDWCRAIAGIAPKSDASSAGSPCWRDYGDGFWWQDVDGFYLPMFTNKPYVSVRRDMDGRIVSTQEFGLGLVTQCEHRLKEGDRITVKITGTHNQQSWAEGDRFVIPVIAAASAPLTGGSDGDPTQTWTVRSTVLGALADWLWDPRAPAPWAHAPATVALLPGGIAFEVGDVLSFDIEGGRLRWRRDGAAWTEADLYAAVPHVLGDGLALQATAAGAPSFLPGDVWQFGAVAEHGVSRMRQPRVGRAFAWDGAALTIDLDFGAPKAIEAVMLAMHDIDLDATVTVSGGLVTSSEWSLPAALHAGMVLALVDAAQGAAVRYVQITIADAGLGGSIGWLWAGMGWRPTVGPSEIVRQRSYGLARGKGLNPSALYRGAGTGGRWSWEQGNGGALLAGEAQALLELIDYAAAQGMEPVAMIPDVGSSADAAVALIDADGIETREYSQFQHAGHRMVSLTLPLRAVLA